MREILAQPLHADAFARFGEVIEARAGAGVWINAGFAEKFADLARIDASAADGRPALHLYRARGRELPLEVRVMERHRFGSQAFVPLGGRPFLVVVAPPGERVAPEDVRAFACDGNQGCNIAPGVWHHALVALHPDSLFVVVDRVGPVDDCDEVELHEPVRVLR